MAFRLRLLGIPCLHRDDGSDVSFPIGKPLALLAYLAFEDREVRREELAGLLWPDSSPDRARHSVRQAIWLIRRKLGDGAIQGEDHVSVSEAEISSDVKGFRTALSRGDIDAAIAVWHGPFLSRLVFTDCRAWERWREEQKELLRLGFSKALLHRCADLKTRGQEQKSLDYLEVLLRLNPYSVEGRVLKVECLLALGRLPSARQALEEARRELEGVEGARVAFVDLETTIRASHSESGGSAQERMGESLELVGRAGELAELRALWRRVLPGHPACACILGPTGIGKTRLANAFLAGIETTEARAVRAKGYRGEHRIPWGTVTDLVRQLLSLPGAKGISPGSDAVLRAVLPSLRTTGNGSGNGNGTGSRGTSEPGEVHPAALADAVADLVGAVGFEGPMALFLDDWQWADKESRSLLAKVMRQVGGLPILFLLAERTGERRLLQERAGTLVGEMGGPLFTLMPLSKEELAELVGLLAEISDPDQTDDLVERVHRVTGGNPLFVGELLRKLGEEGVYRKEGDRWILVAEEVPEALDLPESVQDLIRARLQRLTPTAAQVAGALATERRSVPSRMLRKRAGLDEAVFTRAVAELVDREVLSWVGPQDLDFEHDQLREAAASFFEPSPRRRLRYFAAERPGWVAVGVTGLLVTVVLIFTALTPNLTVPGGEGPPPPFGAGQLLLLWGDSTLGVRPPDRESGSWALTPGVSLPKHTDERHIIRGAFRTATGRVRWFGDMMIDSISPMAAEFLEGGSTRIIRQSPGDDMFRDFHAGRGMSLVGSENPRTDHYDHELLLYQAGTEEPLSLYQAQERIRFGLWSPDAHRIAVGLRASIDTLAILTPLGDVLDRFAFPEYRFLRDGDWCDDNRHMVLRVDGSEGSVGVLFDTDTGSRSEFGAEFAAVSNPVCLGQAAGAAAVVSDSEAWTLRAFQFPSGRVERLPAPPSTEPGRVIWIPDAATLPVRQVQITNPQSSLMWGISDTLAVVGIRADGRREPVVPAWTTSDPSVVSITPQGVVTANRAGEAWVRAVYRSWLIDSLQIQVEDSGETRPDLLLRASFSGTRFLEDWFRYGEQLAEAVEVDGDTVLSMTGDGRYRDGVHTLSNFSLHQGATLELEFRLPLERTDRERLAVCLTEDPLEQTTVWELPLQSTNSFCFVYPSNEQLKFREDFAMVRSGAMSEGREISVYPYLPSDGWVHLALQVRADGATAVFLDRQLAFSPEEPLVLGPGRRWRIDLHGASVDTDLWIRSLNLWRGERFNRDGVR